MKYFRFHVVAACAATLAVLGCGKEQSAPGAPAKVVKEVVPPYVYPPPVKGHYKAADIGEFDLVDGIAYAAPGGSGTVVYVTDKAIASPMLANSACPMTQARALSKLRNARYVEVTLNPAGQSKYFAAGTAFGGTSREQSVGGHYWSSQLRADAGRAAGGAHHKIHGGFDFDLPLSIPKINEVSESDRMDGRRSDQTAPKPTEQAVTAAYRALHDAAIRNDLKALLVGLGFDPKQAAAIRGLDGIDADLMVYSDRFLVTGTPGEFTAKPGTGYVRAEGANAKGKKFANYYHFTPCGDQMVLVNIAENPQ